MEKKIEKITYDHIVQLLQITLNEFTDCTHELKQNYLNAMNPQARVTEKFNSNFILKVFAKC